MTPLALTLALAILTVVPPLSDAQDRTIWVFDDFEDGDCAATPGECWIPITDSLIGGRSRIRLTRIKEGAAGSRGALRVEGEVSAKGFAGAWSAVAPGGRVGDVSEFAGIRMLARGRGVFSAGLRGGPGSGTNFTAPILVRGEWGLVEIPFATLQRTAGEPAEKFDAANVRWLGVTTREPGPFEIEIDEVALYRKEGSSATAPPPTLAGPALTAREPYTDPLLLAGARWREIESDPRGDGRNPGLPDALAVSEWRDEKRGLHWIRIRLAAPPPTDGIGVNVALDLDGDPANGMAWWGSNTAFRFDRLVTAFVFDTGAEWQGTLGVADAATVEAGDMMTGAFGRPRLILDRKGNFVSVGFPRTALGSDAVPVRALIATGSTMVFNDDVPGTGSVRIER